MGAHGWVAGICQPWGQFFYLGAGWPQWKPLGIPGTHLPLKRGSWLKGHLIMASRNRRYTVAEISDYFDDNFDIPDDGVNSDIEGPDEEDFDEENDLLPEVAISEHEDDEDVVLAALDVEENGDQDSRRGRL